MRNCTANMRTEEKRRTSDGSTLTLISQPPPLRVRTWTRMNPFTMMKDSSFQWTCH